MPDFGAPFSGLANERKLTKEELVRAIRFTVTAEYEAVQMYLQLAESTDNKFAMAVLKDWPCPLNPYPMTECMS